MEKMSVTKSICLIFGLMSAVVSLTPSDHLDNIAEESQERVVGASSQILPNNIFNNGKPFYVEKDPISGQLDFNSKKENDLYASDELAGDKNFGGVMSNDISQIPSNFHDFLNLPVKYSATKFVYPLVSSSYSNLKYQGNNKNFTSNHKNYTTTTTTTTTTTPLPNYSMRLGGYKNHTYRPTLTPPNRPPSITLKPRPISTHNIYLTSTTTRPEKSTTVKLYTKSHKPTKPSLNGPMVHQFNEDKYNGKYTTGAVITTTTTTTTTPKPTTRFVPPSTTTTRPPTTYYQSTGRPQTTFSSTFRPIPTSIPSFTTENMISTTDGKMTLADLFNSLGVEQPPNLPLDLDSGSIVEFNVNSVNGPGNPQTINIPANRPANTFNIPKPPQIPHRFPSQTPQQSGNNFVTFDIKPGTSQLPFSSMNNIVISPDQDSASFILGSQQSFGGQGQEVGQGHGQGQGQYVGSASQENVQYQQGTVIADHNYEYQPQGFMVNKEENKVSTNIRFPSDNPNFDNGQIVNGVLKNELNEPSIAHPQHQVVVFPPNEKMPVEVVNHGLDLNLPKLKQKPTDNRVVFKNEKDVMNLNTKPSYHTLPEDLTPPGEYANKFNRYHNNYRPNTNLPPPPPPAFAYNELMRKPGFNRIATGDRGPQLPNVLPQFRPNSKGSMPNVPNSQVSPPPPPPFRQIETLQMNARPQQVNRRTPLPNPNRFLNKMAPAMMPEHNPYDGNRRVYRVPPPPMITDRVYGGPLPPYAHPPPRRFVDGYPMPIHRNNPPPPKIDAKADIVPAQPPPAFDNDDFYKMPPVLIRQPEPATNHPTVLEPVVTLQMIQSKKLQEKDKNKTINERDEPNPIQAPQGDSKNPLYVVYPIKAGPSKQNGGSELSEGPVVVGQRGDQPPLPPSKIAFDSRNEYQNTPFTIVHNEQEPILVAKDKNSKPFRAKFPYNLEKPDPLTVAELDRQSYIKKGQLNDFEIFNTGEAPFNAIGRVVNKPHLPTDEDLDDEDDYLYGKGTQRPIAIAYTPTEPPKYYDKYPVNGQFSRPNFDGPIAPEMTEETQKEDFPPYSKDDVDELGFPSRGDNYDQSFQAPFYPSVSLGGTVIKSEYEGWSVVPSGQKSGTTPAPLHKKNNINRSDNNEQEKLDKLNIETESTTKSFDPDNFQPEFETGFQPIIPSITSQKLIQVQSPRPSQISTTHRPTKTTVMVTTKTPPSTTVRMTMTTGRPTTTKTPTTAPEPDWKNEKNVDSRVVVPPTTTEKSIFDLLFGPGDDDEEMRSLKRSASHR